MNHDTQARPTNHGRQTEHPTPSRLYRSRADRMIGGVAAGLARYFGIETTLVRLIAVILGIAGPGVPIYIVLWIVVPEAPAESEVERHPEPETTVTAKRRFAGVALVGVGVWMLAERWLPWIDEILWPSVLVALGAMILVYGLKR